MPRAVVFHQRLPLIAGLLLFSLLDKKAFAQRWIIIPPPRPVPPPAFRSELRLKSLNVSVEVQDGLAKTVSEQVFKNDQPYNVEATYLFPLPESGVVSDFSLYIDGKKVAAEVLDKDKARSIYEDIVRKLRDPALLEYAGKGLLKLSIFPVPANSEQKVQLEYSQHLPAENGMYRYTYPLALPEATQVPESLVIQGVIRSREPIKTVYSPTHPIDSTNKDEHTAKFSLETKSVSTRNDFTLYYGVSNKDFGAHLLTYKKRGEDGYFLMTLSPRRDWQAEEIAAKDVVFVLDTSGSMAGEKIEQAKRVLRFCLDNLNKKDRFDIVTFSTEVRTFGDTVTEAGDENLRRAREFVDDTKARGGTDIDRALTQALEMIPARSRSPIIIFITDGQPTVGETDESTIVKGIDRLNASNPHNAKESPDRPGARLFAFGLGYDVNTHLLDRLAEDNRGVSEYVQPNEDMEVKISSFYEKISYPVMTDLQIDWGKLKVYDVYPKNLPDLFKGSQVTIFGRYQNAGKTDIELAGLAQGKKKQFHYRLEAPDQEREDEAIPRLWASRKVGYLLNEIHLHGEDKELKEEIVRLSLEFGIVTPYTSMLVQEDQKRDRVVTHGYSGGFGGGAGPMGPPAPRASFEAKDGRDAVRVSGSISTIQQADNVTVLGPASPHGGKTETMRRAGNKTFYWINGVWTDSALKQDQKTLKVKFLSAAYFELSRKDPELAKYFALGDKVIICQPKVSLEITVEGKEELTADEMALVLAN